MDDDDDDDPLLLAGDPNIVFVFLFCLFSLSLRLGDQVKEQRDRKKKYNLSPVPSFLETKLIVAERSERIGNLVIEVSIVFDKL